LCSELGPALHRKIFKTYFSSCTLQLFSSRPGLLSSVWLVSQKFRFCPQAVLALAEAADVELVVQGQALDAFIHVRNQAFIQLVQGKSLLGNKPSVLTI
jgi:hypothetical protein